LLLAVLSSCEVDFSISFIKETELKGAPVTKEISLPYEEAEGLDLSIALNIAEDDGMRVTVLPIEDGKEPRALITYPRDLGDYDFSATFTGDALALVAEDKYRFSCDVKVMDIVLYADLRSCTLSGAMDIEMDYHRPCESLDLTVNGATECEIDDLDCERLDVTCNGASALSVDGVADTFVLTLNGAGDVEATDLKATTCEVTIHGAGNAEVYASTNLKVGIYGVGSVSYLGDPLVEQTIGGAGSVKKLRDRDI
jgi:hypothetical protein